jgi:hypothetical protein
MNPLTYFIEYFQACPVCNSSVLIEAQRLNHHGVKNHSVSLQQTPISLDINVSTDYFVHPSHTSFNFSMKISNNIIQCSKNSSDFLSLYDFSIGFIKQCHHCITKDNTSWRQNLFIFYDRPTNTFQIGQMTEYFMVYDEASRIFYHFGNSFSHEWGSITTSTYDDIKSETKLIPCIPIKDFNLSDNESTISKLKSILLLA